MSGERLEQVDELLGVVGGGGSEDNRGVAREALAEPPVKFVAALGHVDTDAAAIVLVDAAVDEIVGDKAIDEPRETRAGDGCGGCELAHRVPITIGEQGQHMPCVDARSLGLQAAREALRQHPLRTQKGRGKSRHGSIDCSGSVARRPVVGMRHHAIVRPRANVRPTWADGRFPDVAENLNMAGSPSVDIALLVPLSGSAGIFGPSSELCARLAVEEINASGGLLDRPVRLVVVDGSGQPQDVADGVEELVTGGVIDAVVGWHISAVRRAVAPRLSMRVPYVYTALYEGGETTPGVFLVGETPDQQVFPALRWLAEERGLRRWAIVGNDYVWPRRTAAAARRYADHIGGEICDETFVPLGSGRFTTTIGRLLASRAEGVLMLLVGEDAARFNRAFADVGLDESCCRLSPLVDENTLLASGVDATANLCAAAAYFETLATPQGLAFGARYVGRFGADAPVLNSPAESCYEGLMLLSALVRSAQSLDAAALSRVAGRVEYDGPRGGLHLHRRHLQQPVYLAEAEGFEFRVAHQL